MIESLKIVVTNVHSSYAQLRHSQEEKCGRYEKDAGHIMDEMIREEAGVGADNVCSMFFVALDLLFVYYVDCSSLNFFLIGWSGIFWCRWN